METTVGNVTLDVDSGLWVSEDLKILLHQAGNSVVEVVFAFPRMNEVDVGEVVIEVRGKGQLREDVIPLALGIFGRSLLLYTNDWASVTCLGISVRVQDSEAARGRVTFNITFPEME